MSNHSVPFNLIPEALQNIAAQCLADVISNNGFLVETRRLQRLSGKRLLLFIFPRSKEKVAIMSDKNEFARCVPAMFQESAVNWLLDKLSGDLEDYRLICAENPAYPEGEGCFPLFVERSATLRANAVRQTLLCLYSEKADQRALNVNIEGDQETLQERVNKVLNAVGGSKCHTGSR